ncbi:MAG: hypothetical protein ACKVRP_14635 [Bacteroidota bacterium]
MGNCSITVLDKDRKFRDTILVLPTAGVVSVRICIDRGEGTEALFYGVVDFDSVVENEKTHVVSFSCLSSIDALRYIPIDTLYAWLQSHGCVVDRGIIYPFNRTLVVQGKAVSLSNVLNGLASLAGLGSASNDVLWEFNEYAAYGGAGFTSLYVITKGNYYPAGPFQSMFDADLERSPMSFYRFGSCLELLKYLQLSFFSFASVKYDVQTDVAVLRFRQRGNPNQTFIVDGQLLTSRVTRASLSGVLVKNIYGKQSLLPDPNWQPSKGETLYGSLSDSRRGLTLELPLKTVENPNQFQSGTKDDLYSYLHVELTLAGAPPNTLFTCGSIDAHGWPLNGVEYLYLHAALANAYGRSRVGAKEYLTRTFHGISARVSGVSSAENLLVGATESFVRPGQVQNLESVSTEIDLTKNTCSVTGVLL